MFFFRSFSGILFFESLLILIVDSNEDNNDCSGKNHTANCYFRPQPSWSSDQKIDWQTAWRWCKDRHASLPVLRNKEDDTQFMGYLKRTFPQYAGDVWTAANLIDRDRWTWTDGQEFKASDVTINQINEFKYQTSVILGKNLKYATDYPFEKRCYICQYTDFVLRTDCLPSPTSVFEGNRCYRLKVNEQLNWYAARNQCLEGGGDLATFETIDELNRIKNLTSTFGNDGCWVGVHKGRWIWNVTADKAGIEVKFSKWSGMRGTAGHIMCTVVGANDDGWLQEPCSGSNIHGSMVVCQEYSALSITEQEDQRRSVVLGIIIVTAVSVSVFFVIIIIIVVVVVKKKCMKRNGRSYESLKWHEVLRMNFYETLHQTSQPPVPPMKPLVPSSQPPVNPSQPPVTPMNPLVHSSQPPVNPSQPPVPPMKPSYNVAIQATQKKEVDVDYEEPDSHLELKGVPSPHHHYEEIEDYLQLHGSI